ncbi:hypothetical protein CYLTODRAFT_47260 [Cylindrobasidium torrendii FP15055 ss-10]|uniref:Fe2OG dioxygenase domain-containing protein n=1 Tax=Cylindrobasidium torrendii FP15055 ss-10 TaxID=1314674 RepID=A0A0D7BPD4_9AGAR|nr:hypothetical protein CYLTODRAFT_47260 [Cylindrobasidium torrendii FP15055 ss-10]
MSKESEYLVPGHPTVRYIPEFITSSEEEYLLKKIQETPHPKWKQLGNRRLQLLGGELTAKNNLLPKPMPPYMTVFPDLISRLKNTGAFEDSPHGAPNHVILNEYCPNQGIMPHQDGPAYHPVVATISLASHAVFHYYQYKDASDGTEGRRVNPTPLLSVVLEPRSLVITSDSLYQDCLHGIESIAVDSFATGPHGVVCVETGTPIANAHLLRSPEISKVVQEGGVLERTTRYSLTCRDISKVKKLPF